MILGLNIIVEIYMKKLFATILVFAMVACCLCAFAGCDRGGDKIKLVNVELTGEQYGYCVDKSNGTLLSQVNAFLTQISNDGTLETLYAKYDATKNAGYSSITGIGANVATSEVGIANPLIVATNIDFEPFEYKNGKNICGIDMEIASLLAKYLGKTLVVKDMDFDAVVTSVEQGICDIGMAGLTISADRAETVTFSKPYYGTTQMILVRANDTTFDNCTTKEQVEQVLKSLRGKKAGAQAGTTGFYYIDGSQDFGFAGFDNIQMNAYEGTAFAVTDMINGVIDFVVVDKDLAKVILSKVNI
jgi:polar amino acid transport system substrate-binding protein